MNYLKLVFSLSIIYLSLSAWMVNSWLTLWMLMEVSLPLFLGLLAMSSNYSTVELMIKYYIIQALSGLILVGCLVLSLLAVVGSVDWIIILVLFIKLGLAPFHSWMISIVGKVGWLNFLLMATFLKLVPMLMVSQMAELVWVGPVAILSVLVGSVMGINEVHLQKLLGYSSMVSLAWLVYASLAGFFFFFFFWLGYLSSLVVLCGLFSSMNIYYLNQFKFGLFSLSAKFMFLFLALSFAGVPPFLGFLLKWTLTYFILFLGAGWFVCVLVIMSLFSTFYYLQLWFYVLLLFSFELKWFSFSLIWVIWSFSLFLFNYLIFLVYLVV